MPKLVEEIQKCKRLKFDSESPVDEENSIWGRKVQNQMFMDSIKFYPRFNWIHRGFDCKKIDFGLNWNNPKPRTKPEKALKLRDTITILARIWLQSCKKFNGWIKRNQAAPFHHVIVCNSWCSLIIKEGDVGSDNGVVSKSRRERITADNPHHRDARRLTKNILILRL